MSQKIHVAKFGNRYHTDIDRSDWSLFRDKPWQEYNSGPGDTLFRRKSASFSYSIAQELSYLDIYAMQVELQPVGPQLFPYPSSQMHLVRVCERVEIIFQAITLIATDLRLREVD